MRTATLLLTDVVDSTQLTEELGTEAMAAVWQAHDDVARALLVEHGGREIDKTDGFLLLFNEAGPAVAYALAYHEALRALPTPLKARAGLHVGEVLLRKSKPEHIALGAKPLEVEGLAKPFAARIMSLAQGGQTLLSPSAHAALGASDRRTTSHGHWRMKGVIDPVELFEVGDDDAPFTPPPDGAKVWRVVLQSDTWVPVREVETTLLRERDAFVGRQDDLLELARLLDGGAALISLLGIGGTGKTRLATHYGWTWLGAWPGGVYFCDLSEARSVDGIVFGMGRGLGIPVTARDPLEQIGFAIEARGKCLLILDNFEQVTRHAAETLGGWLDAAPEAQFVVTTREVLGLPGERAMALAPLTQDHAVSLFAKRGAAAKRGFTLTEANRQHVTELVALLDRLPLAIELAAARVRMMPPKKLLQRMGQRFKLLTSTGGRRDRQATLRAAIDWSWDLLSDDEKAGLAQLSSFEGGFTLEAAEAVLECGDAWGTDILRALIDKSLVRQVSDERFDLLVSVQVYATEKLEASPGRDGAWTRHAEHYAALDDYAIWKGLGVGDDGPRAEELFVELENAVVTFRRCMAAEWWELAERTAFAVGQIARRHGPPSAGLAVLPALDAKERIRARGVVVLARLLEDTGRTEEAMSEYRRAVELGNGSYWSGRAWLGLSELLTNQGELDAAADCIERVPSNPELHPHTLLTAGYLSEARGDLAKAELQWSQELAVRQARGLQVGRALLHIGVAAARRGDLRQAKVLWRRAVAASEREGASRTMWTTRSNLGEVTAMGGDVRTGLHEMQAAADGLRAMGQAVHGARLACGAGWLALHAGRPHAAQTILNSALAGLARAGHNWQFHAQIWLGVTWHLLGEPSSARHALDAAAGCAIAHFSVPGEAHLALLDLHEGVLDATKSRALSSMEQRQSAGEYALIPCIALAQVHIALGELDEARAVVDIGWTDDPPPLWAAELYGCEVLLAAAHGDREAYDRHVATLAQWPELGQPDSPLGRVLARAAATMAANP